MVATVLEGSYEGWVIQAAQGQTRKTAVIGLGLLDDNEMTFLQLMRTFEGRGSNSIDDDEVVRWGLRQSDKVAFDFYPGTRRVRILAVWGNQNPEACRNRRSYSRIMRSYTDVTYSGLPITLEVRDLYPIQTLYRYPLGGQIILAGEAGAGKSSLNLLVEEAMLAASLRYPTLNFAYIYWHLGERTVDRNTITPVRAKYPGCEVYLFGPPRGIAGHLENINTIEFIKGLIERLFELGRNVIVCGDGLRGLVLDAYGQHENARLAGLTGSGVSAYGIREAVKFLAHAGYTPWGSMTNIVTSLAAPPGGRGQAEQIRLELGLPEATMVEFVAKMNGGVAYPKFYLPGCDLRRPEILFRDKPLEFELHTLMHEWISKQTRFDQRDPSKVTNAPEILRILQDFAQTTAATFEEAIPHWVEQLKKTQFAVGGKAVDPQQKLVNAVISMNREPLTVKKSLLEFTARTWNLEIVFKDDTDSIQAPAAAPIPEPEVVAALPVAAVVTTATPDVSDNTGEPAMATYEEIMAKWQTLATARIVRSRGKFNHRAKQLEGTITLEDFERKARAGEYDQ